MKNEKILMISKFIDDLLYENNPTFECNDNNSLHVYISDDKPLEVALKDKESLDTYFKDLVEPEYEDLMPSKKEIKRLKKVWRYYSSNFDNLIDMFDYVQISPDFFDELEYFVSNPLINKKKIVLSDAIKVTEYDKLVEIEKKYSDIKDQIYITLYGNNEFLKLEDVRKSIEKIKNIADSISKLNLSPLETMMYVYDIVRKRIYKEEDKSQSPFESRNLTSILSGNKIVCVGYSALFQAILNYMGFEKVGVMILEKQNSSGHERNFAYIKDDKYGVDGVYYFDATWDSRKNENDKEYLKSYKYFARTYTYITNVSDKDYIVNLGPLTKNEINDIKRLLEEDNLEGLKKYLHKINFMNEVVNDERLIKPNQVGMFAKITSKETPFDYDTLVDKLFELEKKFNTVIPAETLINVARVVRKIEHYQNPQEYPYALDEILNIVFYSNWNFKDISCLSDMEQLYLISEFVEEHKIDDELFYKLYYNYKEKYKDEIEREVQEVNFTKVLKNHLENQNRKM